MIAKDEGYRRFIQKFMFDITVVVLTGMKRQALYECKVVIYLLASPGLPFLFAIYFFSSALNINIIYSIQG